MSKRYKKRNMKTSNEKNLRQYFYKNRPMYDEIMYNIQKFRNYRYVNNCVPPSESQYYDTYEPQNENSQDIITPGGSKEPRVIRKRNLYRNLEKEPNASSPPQTYALGYSQNMTYWQKASDTYTETYLPQGNRPPPSNRTLRKQAKVQKNKVEKTLNSMLSKPVEISKGKSLLEKMGWTGGGLGKDGNGIVNPIVPKAAYATSTLGLGHNSVTERDQNKPSFKENISFGPTFQTNVLLKILEFVKNDYEVDLLFDRSLYNKERKKIHRMVEALRTCTDVDELNFVKPLDIEIASEILSCNMYMLQTESYGKHPARSLRLYKEAPSYVYLITPADLKDDDDEEFNDFCEPLDIDTKDKTENEIETFTEKVKHLEVEKEETRNDEQDHNNISLNSSIEETTITREDLKTKNDDSNINHELNVEKVSHSKKILEVHDSTSNVNCQLDSVVHSKNDDPNFNHELNVEKVSDSNKFMEVDNSTSSVTCLLDSKQHSETGSLKRSLDYDKTIEKNFQVENKEKINLDSNTTIEQEIKNIDSENPGNELNESSEQNSEKTLLGLIVEYFKEFIIDTSYLEFRFLGPFNSEELDAVNTFFDICLKRDNEDSIEKVEILKALNNEVYNIEVKENLNGSNVVYKSEKCLQQMTPQ